MDDTTDYLIEHFRGLMSKPDKMIDELNKRGNSIDYVIDSVKTYDGVLIKRVNGVYKWIADNNNILKAGDIKLRPYEREQITSNLLDYLDKIKNIINNDNAKIVFSYIKPSKGYSLFNNDSALNKLTIDIELGNHITRISDDFVIIHGESSVFKSLLKNSFYNSYAHKTDLTEDWLINPDEYKVINLLRAKLGEAHVKCTHSYGHISDLELIIERFGIKYLSFKDLLRFSAPSNGYYYKIIDFNELAPLRGLESLSLSVSDNYLGTEEFIKNLKAITRTVFPNKKFNFTGYINPTGINSLKSLNCLKIDFLDSDLIRYTSNCPLVELVVKRSSFNLTDIKPITKLKSLTIDSSNLVLNDKIGDFSNLRTLIINNCPIERLPFGIKRLSKLNELSVTNTKLLYLPEGVKNLTNLSDLTLIDNELTELPDLGSHISKNVKLKEVS